MPIFLGFLVATFDYTLLEGVLDSMLNHPVTMTMTWTNTAGVWKSGTTNSPGLNPSILPMNIGRKIGRNNKICGEAHELRQTHVLGMCLLSAQALGNPLEIPSRPRFPKPFDRWRGVCIAMVDRGSVGRSQARFLMVRTRIRRASKSLDPFRIFQVIQAISGCSSQWLQFNLRGKIDVFCILQILGPRTCVEIVYFYGLLYMPVFWIMIHFHCRSNPT